jgi:hypothetical protein
MSLLHKYSDPLLSTLLKHLWQRLQPWVFLGMTLQAWHTCIWVVSTEPLKLLSGWMGSYFQVSPDMFDWVQVRVKQNGLAGQISVDVSLDLQPLLSPLGSCSDETRSQYGYHKMGEKDNEIKTLFLC